MKVITSLGSVVCLLAAEQGGLTEPERVVKAGTGI